MPTTAQTGSPAHRRVSSRRLARQYALVTLLIEARGDARPMDWLARELGVSVRTVERDLEALRAARLPLRGRGGSRGGVWLDAHRASTPLDLSPAQVAALLVSLESLDANLPPQYETVRETLLRHLTGPRLF